ncbi:putative amidase [Aureobasidium subglaciale]|nr:putative amidase [Aureobasidium subglaciale]
MSVLFTSISAGNTVSTEDVRSTFAKLNVSVPESEEDDYQKLLAAIHDCADTVAALPDFHPSTDLERFPRNNVQRPTLDKNVLGHAWAHNFSIKDKQPSGPLTGKTVCLKDCICVAGVPQLLGTDIIDPWIPEADATVVRWALEAGAEIVGTAHCENWCQSTSSFSGAQGIVQNPYAEGYSAGGSTSGAAALVAGGLVDVGIGADQGGSIRVPASLCGCVGLKPTHGLVPYTGIASNDPIDDHAGPLARTVLEAAECLDAISGYDSIDDRSLGAPKHNSTSFAADLKSADSAKGMRVGILTEAFEIALLDKDVKSLVLSAANKFKALGAMVEEVSIPMHPVGNAVWTIQQRISGYLALQGQQTGRHGYGLTGLETAKLPWTQGKFDKCFPTTKNIFLNGKYLIDTFPALYPKAQNLCRQLRIAYEQAFENYDVLITPTTPFVAPKHGALTTPIATIAPTVGLTSNTVQFDATGQPAMTIPIGFIPAKEDDKVMLPVGMQIIGGMWQDGKVLRAGHAWQSAFDWKAQYAAAEIKYC